MADVFVYAPDCADFENIGEAGSLTPTSCIHAEIANGMSELEIVHPIDEMGKWSYLQSGYILAADVPVRTLPEISGGQFVTSVENWTIRLGAPRAQCRVWSRATGGKVKSTTKNMPKPGAVVTVVAKGENRYKIKFRNGMGWIAIAALENRVDITIPDTAAGIEQVAPAWTVRPQRFRIYKVEKTDTEVTALAQHIFYDESRNITTYKADNPTCIQALNGLISGRVVQTDIDGTTNIAGQRVGVDWTRTPFIDALLNPETGLVARWGAELVRDDEEFCILANAGIDRGVRIEYGKNLLGVSLTLDESAIITRYIPVGQTKKGKPLLLAAGTYNTDHGTIVIPAGQTWIDAPNSGDYPIVRTEVLDLGGDAKAAGTSAAQVRDAREKMIDAALYKFEREQTNYPAVTLNVDFVQLGDTEEFAQYRQLENVFLFDPVRVWHPLIGVDIDAEVTEYEWDCLRDRAHKITLGNVNPQNVGARLPSWQLPSTIPGSVFKSGSIDGGAIADGTVNDDQLAPESIAPLHLQAATIDELMAGSIVALTAKIEQIVAGGIVADELYAAVAELVTLRVAQAVAGTITTDELRAHLAEIANVQIDNADIDFAKIKDLIAGEAILEQGVGGEFFFKKLAITDANILGLTVGSLVVRGNNGKYYRVTVDENGTVSSTEVKMDGGNIADDAIEGRHIVEDSILTRHLDADEIFGQTAIITKILAGLVNTGMLVANEGFIGQLTASDAILRHIRSNATPRVQALPADPVIGQTVVYTGSTPSEALHWTGNGSNPTQRSYPVTKSGASVVFSDLSDDRSLAVTVKCAVTQPSTPTLGNQQPITGNAAPKIVCMGKNLIKPGDDQTIGGVTFAWNSAGGVQISGTSTAPAGSPSLYVVPLPYARLDGTFTLFIRNADVDSSLQVRLMESSNAQVTSAYTNLAADVVSARKSFTLIDQPIYGYAIRIEGGKTYDMTLVISLEPGETATAYEPYSGIEHTLAPPAPLYGLTGYEDEITNDGQVAHRTKYIKLDGTEAWSFSGTQPSLTTLARFQVNVSDIKMGARGISSAFEWIANPGAQTTQEAMSGHPSGQNIHVFIVKSRVAGSSGAYPESGTNAEKVAWFKALMAIFKPEAVYELATPTTTTIAPVQIVGADGINTVSSTGAAVDVSYTGSGWQRLGNEVVGTSVEITQEKFRVATSEVEFAIYGADGEEAISKIDEDGAYFPALEAPDVSPRWPGPYSITVDPAAEPDEDAGLYNSLQAVANAVSGRFLSATLVITIDSAATFYGDALFDRIGGGQIAIRTSGAGKPTIYGSVGFQRVFSDVSVRNLDISYTGAASVGALWFNIVQTAEVTDCNITKDAAASSAALYASAGTKINCINCGLYGGDFALWAQRTAFVSPVNCYGGGALSAAVYSNGAVVLCAGTIPAGVRSKVNNGILDATGCVEDAGTSGTPSSSATVSYDATSSGYYRTAWQSGSQMRQGYTGYELTGWFRFDNDALRSVLSGKTIKDAKLRLRRVSGLGVSTAIKVRLYGTTKASKSGGQPDRPIFYGNIGKIGNGKTVTFTIPTAAISDLVSGAINGFVLYARDGAKLAGKAYSANYGGYYGVGADGPQITVTY